MLSTEVLSLSPATQAVVRDFFRLHEERLAQMLEQAVREHARSLPAAPHELPCDLRSAAERAGVEPPVRLG